MIEWAHRAGHRAPAMFVLYGVGGGLGTGYVFQESRLFPHMSVADNIPLTAGAGREEKASEAEDQRASWRCSGWKQPAGSPPARRCRGGEKGRVALARVAALLSVAADSPAGRAAGRAWTRSAASKVLPYLERLRDEAKLPMLYVSHSLEEIARLADDIVIVRDGRVVRQGSVFEVLTGLELAALAGSSPMGAVIAAKIAVKHRADGLTELSFDGGLLVCVSNAAGRRRRQDVARARSRGGNHAGA